MISVTVLSSMRFSSGPSPIASSRTCLARTRGLIVLGRSAKSFSITVEISSMVRSRSSSSERLLTSSRRRSICLTSAAWTRARQVTMSGGPSLTRASSVESDSGAGASTCTGLAGAGGGTLGKAGGGGGAAAVVFAAVRAFASENTRNRYSPTSMRSVLLIGPRGPVTALPLTFTGARPPVASMNTPASVARITAWRRAMVQPCSTTRLSSLRPMPHSWCRHRILRASLRPVSTLTVNMRASVEDVAADGLLEVLEHAVALLDGLQVQRIIGMDHARRHEHDQVGAAGLEIVGAEQPPEHRDVGQPRNAREPLRTGDVDQPGDHDRLPVADVEFGIRAAGQEAGDAGDRD